MSTGCPVASGPRVDEQFAAIVCADDEWVRAEFDALVAAAWDDPPATPGPVARPPAAGRPAPRWRPEPERPPRRDVGVEAWARQRSPPGKDRRSG